jgi:hypothetical protein
MNAKYFGASILCLAIAASANAIAACDDDRSLLRDEAKRIELLQWADAEIFSRKFSQADFRVAGMIGPGRYGANFSTERSGIRVPEWLSDYVIRAVGPDRFHPNVLFVGKFRYQGIIITRGEFESSLAGTPVEVARLDEWSGRLGLMCYADMPDR